MPTASYQNGYFDVGNDTTVTLFPEDADPDTVFSFEFDGELIKGEVVTLTYPNGSFEDLEFYGLNANGEPGFVEVGQSTTATNATKFLTNDVYAFGDDFPEFDDSQTYVCFLPGTMIATPEGEVAVESLSIGDLVNTADGRTVPVRWLGRQTVVARFGIPEGRRPVHIVAGALGADLPKRDLRVTSDHALLIENVLVHAGALVNGTTIRRIPLSELGERFLVYHIETENHEVIVAEGTPAETFIDNVPRARFDNYAEYLAQYGDKPPAMVELSQPRAMSRRQVPPAILALIAAAASRILVTADKIAS